MKAAESSIFVINITGKGKGFNCENLYENSKAPRREQRQGADEIQYGAIKLSDKYTNIFYIPICITDYTTNKISNQETHVIKHIYLVDKNHERAYNERKFKQIKQAK